MHTVTTLVAAAAVFVAATPSAAGAAPPPKGAALKAPPKKSPPPAAKPASTPAPAPAPPKPAQAPRSAPAAALPQTAPASPPAARHTNSTIDTELPERELGGHYFLTMFGVRQPFVTSHIGSFTTAGTADANDIPMPEELGGGTMDMPFLGLGQSFELQIAAFDRFALRVGADGSALLPRDEEAALIIAAMGGWSAGAGATAKIVERKYFQVAGSFDYVHGYNVQAVPLGLLASLPDIQPENMFVDVTSDSLHFGAQGAVAPHEVVGIVLDVGWDSETDSDDTNDAFLRLGAGVSLNFEPLGAPVGLVATYTERFAMDAENATELDRTVSGGIYYTGRRYLDVGILVQSTTQDVNDVDISMLTGTSVLRTYF